MTANEKKLTSMIEDLERKNRVLKDSLDFIHEKYPFLWENISILEKKQMVESKNVEVPTTKVQVVITAEEQLKEIEDAIQARMKELKMLSANELECTRKVNAVLEERVKLANKAILEAKKQGFKTDYKF